MDNVFASVLRVSVSGAALTLVLLLLKPLLKNRVPKAFSYYIWILVLLRLALPFGYSVNLPELPQLLPGTVPPAGAEPAVPDGRLPELVPEAGGAGESGHADAGDITPGGNAGAPVAIGTWAGLWKTLRGKLALVWLAGVLLSLGWHAAAYAVFYRKLARSFALPHAEDLAVFRAINKDERIRLVCSGQTDTPMLVGILHPRVVLPRPAYVKNGMEPELCGILRHELTHHSRHDLIYKWAVAFVVGLHWFNPAVYLMRHEINAACELSCDEAVIETMSVSERKAYGNTLLALASKRRLPPDVAATTLSEGKRQLKERLINIMNYKKTTHAAAALMAVLALALTGCAGGIAAFGDSSGKADDSAVLLEPQMQTQSPTGTHSLPANPASSHDGSAEAYKAVLQGDATFFSVDAGETLSIGELAKAVGDMPDGTNVTATGFTALDLDGDGMREVILQLADHYGSIILRYGDDSIVYGYTLYYRAFMGIKTDGTASFSSGAAENGFGTLQFVENACSLVSTTYSTASYDGGNNLHVAYTVDNKPATEAEFLSAIDAQNKKEDAVWYAFTPENIETVISEP